MIWLTVPETAAAAQVDAQRVIRWIRRDRLPAVRGRRSGARGAGDWLVHPVDLHGWACVSLAIEGETRARLATLAKSRIGGAA